MAEPVRARERSRSGAETRALILSVAAELFAESGFDATTVRAIADRCQVTDPALYYHFPSKRHILNALWSEAPAETVPAWGHDDLSREEMARRTEDQFYVWARNAGLLRVLFQQSLEGDETAREFRRRVLDEYRDGMLPSARRLYGEAGDLVIDAVIYCLTGLVFDVMFHYGSAVPEIVVEDSFRRRLRRIIDQALPCPPPDRET